MNNHYYNIQDISTKFPTNHPYNQLKLDSLKFIVSSNQVVQNQKLLYPIINQSINITGQFPSLLKAKKSVASFRLRKNSPIGLVTTLRKQKANSFLNLLIYYVTPRLVNADSYQKNSKGVIKYNISSSKSKGGDGNVLSLGFNNINWFTNITPIAIESLLKEKPNNIGGYIQIKSKYQLPYPYNLNKELKHYSDKFYFSLLLKYHYN